MKKITLFLLLIAFYAINSFAQNDDMKKWMDYMTPGKEQKILENMNGEWVYTSKMWMDPKADPQKMDGTASFEMLLGGRYSQMKVTGQFMGMPFSGIGVNGFDNGKKIWFSTWIDNMGTGIAYMEGTFDEASKKITYKGKMYDPMTGKDLDVKQTIKIVDDKNCEMEMFNMVDGKEFKSMEMKYTKK